MNKFFSIIAAALILFGAASCKNKKDEPSEPKAFTFEISNITDKRCDYTITPANETAEYLYLFTPVLELEAYSTDYANDLKGCVNIIMSGVHPTYSALKKGGFIQKGKYTNNAANPAASITLLSNIEYVLLAFHTDEQLNIIGDVVASEPFYILPADFIDLGLPSGTLWYNFTKINSDDDSQLFTWTEAYEKYGEELPSLEQYQELLSKCTWSPTDDGYTVTGPNGNSISLYNTGTYNVLDNGGAVVVNYSADGVDAGCLYTKTDSDAGKRPYGWFLFFSPTHTPRMLSQSVTWRLGMVRTVRANPNKK